MTLQKYPKIKDSRIEWIGEIPEHWNVKKIKYLLIPGKAGIKIGPFGSSLKLDSMVKSGYKVYGQENVINQDFEAGERFIDKKKFDEMIGHEIVPNDIIVTMMGTTGLSQVVPSKIQRGIMDSHLVRIKSNNLVCDTDFLSLLINSSDYVKFQLKLESKGSIMEGLNSSILKSVKILLPKLVKEQKQIVDYLDEKTKTIDNEISKNQKLIELLKEKRQAIINHAVTKGLDNTVPMKDSDIPWIGEIPKHWNINKIKYTSYVKGRIGWQGLRSDEFTTEGPYLITGTDFIDGKIKWSTCNHVESWRYDQDPYIQIKKNDVLITKDGTIGKVAIIDNIPDKTTLNTGVMVIRPLKNSYDPSYLFWILKSNQFIDFIDLIKQGSTIQHLYQKTFENFPIVIPNSFEEQKQIVDYLDEKTKKTDLLISKVELQIKQLQEFRESLISSAVTGKICVTN